MNQLVEVQATFPKGWISEKLGNIAGRITKGSTPTTFGYSFQKAGINFIKIQNVSAGAINLSSITDFISDEAHQNQGKSILQIDDVLFSIAGTIGETAIVKQQHLPANTNQAFAIISGFSSVLLPKYLEFQLRSFVSQKTKEKARGGAMNNVSLDDLKQLELLLPPFNEQHRIVAKIEELFSELDKGVEALKTAREQLKVYRQALLKHAFAGKLTAAWRAANPDKLEPAAALLARIQTEREQRYRQQLQQWEQSKSPSVPLLQRGKSTSAAASVPHFEKGGIGGISKPKAPKPLPPLTAEELAELPELPEGWGWVKFGQAFNVYVGSTPSRKRADYWYGDIPWVSSGEVAFCRIRETKEKITKLGYEGASTEIHPVGTVMLAMIGEGKTRGQAAILDIEAAHNQNTAAIRVSESGCSPDFVYQYLTYQYEITRKIGSGNNQKALNKERVSELNVPFCSLAEQEQIANELASRLSEADQLDQTLTTSLQQSEALRQSILKRAFSGQLVPQDPHDEPAAVLLERIRAERAIAEKSSVVRARGRKLAG